MQRTKYQPMGELAKAEVPALAPELSERCGAERREHDGFCIDAKALPQKSCDLEGAEVKQLNET
jgi:hypothetical protein